MREMGDVETVIFDIPGVGHSPLSALPYRPATVARWAAGVARELGYERLDVAGVSWGGAMAQQFAHQFPDLCRRLSWPPRLPGFSWFPESPRFSGRWRAHGVNGSQIYAVDRGGDLRRKFHLDPGLAAMHAANMRGSSNLGYVYQLLAVAGWTSVPWLPWLKQPTLIIMGRDDPVVPLVNGRVSWRALSRTRGSRSCHADICSS